MRRLPPVALCSIPIFVFGCFAPPPSENESGSETQNEAESDDDEEGEDDGQDDGQDDGFEAGDEAQGSSGDTPASNSEDDDDADSASDTSSGSSSSSSSADAEGTSTSGGGDADTGAACTDVPPDDRETCATWKEWGECDSEWMIGFCEATCGRCEGGASDTSGGDTSTSSTTASTSSTTGDLGDDNPFPPISGGSMGFTTRYWDCCKPSCGWRANASNPVISCDVSDNSIGVTDEANACERNGTSGAFTCHRMAPWAHSNAVSFGYAAFNGAPCGTCFQLEFTGATNNAGNDPGAQAIAGKTMVVMVTNIGGIQQGQFDLLVPGGGVGDFNGCSGQWGISNSELGAQYGGFLLACKEQNGFDYEQSRQCARDRCEAVFGTRGLTDLYDGCMWYMDWFAAADNPQVRYQQIDCPQELNANAH